MSRINTNVDSLIAQRVLRNNNSSLSKSLERLSTGLKINKGADNPAGLIASENLRAEKIGITTAIRNAERASNIIGTAEGGLSEVSALLTELQGLVGEAANSGGLSDEEIAANQLQVDSILSTINRIAGSTNFQGKKLLDGSLDYTTENVTSTEINNLKINSAKLPDGAEVSVVVDVVTSAQTAAVTFAGLTLAATNTIQVTGNLGTEQLSFAASTSLSDIATAINAVKDATGVSATVNGSDLQLNSTAYGSAQFVTVTAVAGSDFTDAEDTGRDAVVNVNGAAAQASGLSISYRSNNLDLEFDLASAFNVDDNSSTFQITGGGATFALGSKVSETDKASIGIASVTTASLGNSTLGYLSTLGTGGDNSLSSDNLVSAQKILDKAIKQVSQLRGRLGAFQKFTVNSTINNLGVALENASAAESAIRDTDFAEETANLTRSQILAAAATSVLAAANSNPQSVLSLLQG